MKLSLRNNQSGFTIIELLIVIVVIAILAGLVLTTFAGVQERARDSERRTDINGIASHLEVYYADHGHYPDGSTATTCGTGSDSCGLSINTLDGLDGEALNDPNGNAINIGAIPGTATDNEYYYDVTGASCSGGQCDGFSLGSWLEGESTDTVYQKNSLN